MIEMLQYDFMQNAIIAGLFAGITCGVIGTLVVVNRIVFISGGIAHAAYGGIGIAFFFGLPYMISTIGFSLVTALIIAAITLRNKERADTIIGVIWATGMAAGVLLIDLTPGYNVDLMSYLFGSILMVPDSDIIWMSIMSLAVLILVIYFYNDFLIVSYDDEFARVRGIPATFLHVLLICMIAVAVVLLIRVVGLILVLALLTIPPYIAEKYVASLKTMMIFAVLLSCTFTFLGLYLAYRFNLTSGATIIMVAAGGFCFSFIVDRIKSRREIIHNKQGQ